MLAWCTRERNPEGRYPFWKMLLDTISGWGREFEIDTHAKCANQITIDMAATTGLPVKPGARYSAEPRSIGYRRANIRAL